MTFKELEDLAKSVKYKPNFRLDVQRSYGADVIELRFCMYILDAYKQENNIAYNPVLSRVMLTPEGLKGYTRETMISFIFYTIKQQEMHEAQEWFLVGGERVYDPHKKDQHAV